MRGVHALVALVMALLVASEALAHTPDLTPQYLTGTWVAEGTGATCDNGLGYIFTPDSKVVVGDEPTPYWIDKGAIYYQGVDSMTYDNIRTIDRNTMVLRVQNDTSWVMLFRC